MVRLLFISILLFSNFTNAQAELFEGLGENMQTIKSVELGSLKSYKVASQNSSNKSSENKNKSVLPIRLEGILEQGNKTYRVLVIKKGQDYYVSYPDLNCSGLWSVIKGANSIAFKERITKGSRCVTTGYVTLERLTGDLFYLKWRRNKNSRVELHGQLKAVFAKVAVTDNNVVPLVDSKPLSLSDINQNLKVKIKAPPIIGTWNGIGVCKTGINAVSVKISNPSNGSYKIEVDGVGYYNFKTEITKFTGNSSQLDFELKENLFNLKYFANDGVLPDRLILKKAGKCSYAYVYRVQRLDEVGGTFAHAYKPEFCKQVYYAWQKGSSFSDKAIEEISANFSNLYPAYNKSDAHFYSLFSNRRFKAFFGKFATETSAKEFDHIENQYKLCRLTAFLDRDYDKYMLSLYTQESVNIARKGMYEGRFTGVDFVETEFFENAKRDIISSGQDLSVEAILKGWENTLTEEDPEHAIVQFIAKQEDKLKWADPVYLARALTNIREKVSEQVFANKTKSDVGNTLANRPAKTTIQGFSAGRILLSAQFDHYVYLNKTDITEKNCRGAVPARVDLNSLLILNAIKKDNFARRFFWEALNTLEYVCGYYWGVNESDWALDVSYYFDGEKIASVKTHKKRFKYSVLSKNIFVTPQNYVHPRDHANYIFDQAVASSTGDLLDDYGRPIPKPNKEQMQELAKRGDLQAMVSLAFKEKYPKLRFELDNVEEINVNAMQKASDAGSIVASHILAMDLSKTFDLFVRRPGIEASEFYNLPKSDQEMWLQAVIKAKAGNVYWSQYFNEITERWDIKLEDEIAQARKQNFAGKVALTKQATDTLTNGRALKAFGEFMVKTRCNAKFSFVHTTAGIGAFTSNYKSLGNSCLIQTGAYNATDIIHKIDSIENLVCSNAKQGGYCSFNFEVSCRVQSNSYDPQRRTMDKLVFGNICKLVRSKKYRAEAEFLKTGDDNWYVRQVEINE